MIIWDLCQKPILRTDHRIDEKERDLHPDCLEAVNVNRVIIDYVEASDRAGHLLDMTEFMTLRTADLCARLEDKKKTATLTRRRVTPSR